MQPNTPPTCSVPRLTLILTGVALCLFPGMVSADLPVSDNTQRTEWVRSEFTFVPERGFSKEAMQTTSDGEMIHTTANDKRGNVAIICLNGRLMSAISLNEEDIFPRTRDVWDSQRSRRIRPHVKIDGKTVRADYWWYQPKLQLTLPMKSSVSRKFYNAAIRQQNVEVDLSNKKPVTLILPKPNGDFADFGAKCGMGRLKDKD